MPQPTTALPHFRHAALMGATGLVGRHLLPRLARQFERVTVFGRREPARMPLNASWIRTDFTDPGALDLSGVDQAFITFGTTMATAGSRADFRAVDLDMPYGFANAARAAGTERLFLVSAVGADPESWIFYNRVKGELERELEKLRFPSLVIFRPSLLLGEHPGRAMEQLSQLALTPFRRWLPATARPIEADELAQAICNSAASAPEGTHLLMGADLWQLVKAPVPRQRDQ
ncbi:NAD(P)H-binding protein [Natronospirillum operosum]|nr:NAD(P)H-binding protein [Natronospirillum operosum]